MLRPWLHGYMANWLFGLSVGRVFVPSWKISAGFGVAVRLRLAVSVRDVRAKAG